MNATKNLDDGAAINKLKEMIAQIKTCLFCSNLKHDNVSTCRPMTVLQVCDQGKLWFFSERYSVKNKEIEEYKTVNLFFSDPSENSYLVIHGEAEIIIDPDKTEELWTATAQLWFPLGKEDPTLSIIKVSPTSAYYWDTDGNKMIDVFLMAASLAAGKNLTSSNKGELQI